MTHNLLLQENFVLVVKLKHQSKSVM